ncbi:hypothetical protein A2483_05375 [Candidatus Peregrinibacteria bacterium RIFOXYC2_FULL_33_13]|nr:MAG: hypothetical protein UR27_C0007G0064 [Candidatus Peregrinibacteria bacterium GW2011_GWA2_33_10]KKP40875.1 MAG: hypothetical protein UR30_C0003G0047 [Candidatus Peregrinibacteria bacterium GW2011_GWC2_33_13]OGJ50762.1 MAG: hypothetical protein A2229_05410 [Candidatus Peregrinibacteria bacterium RIFOXYA2_FULL_33_7]OGJ54845.1 MAG: hypothetical protein A2483_05375 [Candidatus Peregrinibacteria bacterium RIFOXYC2_FULL_33_13]
MDKLKVLEHYRQKAENYYKTEKYQELVKELYDILKDVKGKIIAFDIEGTLISSSNEINAVLSSPNYIDTYLRRPLAKEITNYLSSQNEVIIWSAMTRKYMKEALSSSKIGLNLNKNNKQISREDCKKSTKKHPLIKIWHQKANSSEKLMKELITSGTYKIPSIFDVDFLIDDLSEFHKEGCDLILIPEDKEKIISIPSFKPDFEQNHQEDKPANNNFLETKEYVESLAFQKVLHFLATHYKDQELLEVAKKIQKKCA